MVVCVSAVAPAAAQHGDRDRAFRDIRAAAAERQRTKAWDCDVSVPFLAGSRHAADLRAQRSWV
jgi:hypothetical protein